MLLTLSKIKSLKEIKATRINHGCTESEQSDWIAQVLHGLTEQGADPKIEDNQIVCNNGQFVTIPSLKQTLECALQIRSNDYICHYNDKKSYGSLPKKECLTNNGFIVKDFKNNTIITYILHITL